MSSLKLNVSKNDDDQRELADLLNSCNKENRSREEKNSRETTYDPRQRGN